MYYIANSILFWTFGVYSISRDGNGDELKLFSLEMVKEIFSPPFLGFLLAMFLVTTGITLPKVLLETCKYLGLMTTPLSMLFIGIAIYGVNRKQIKLSKELIAIAIGRFLISPMLVLLTAYFIPIPLLMKKVFVIQSAMPIMTMTTIIAKKYQADFSYSAVMTTVTTVLAAIVIPLYMYFLKD